MRHDRSKAERSLARYKGDEIVKDVSRKYARFNQESVKRCANRLSAIMKGLWKER